MRKWLGSVVVGLLGGSTTTFETEVMLVYNFKVHYESRTQLDVVQNLRKSDYYF